MRKNLGTDLCTKGLPNNFFLTFIKQSNIKVLKKRKCFPS